MVDLRLRPKALVDRIPDVYHISAYMMAVI